MKIELRLGFTGALDSRLQRVQSATYERKQHGVSKMPHDRDSCTVVEAYHMEVDLMPTEMIRAISVPHIGRVS